MVNKLSIAVHAFSKVTTEKILIYNTYKLFDLVAAEFNLNFTFVQLFNHFVITENHK